MTNDHETGAVVSGHNIESLEMSPEDLLDRITKEVWSLRYDLQQFTFAFAKERFRVDVMNAVAPRFFVRWQLLIYDRIVLGVARLFDTADMRGKKNISLYALLAANGWSESAPEKHSRMASAVDTARDACEGCIQHRHKRISHWDQLSAAKLHVLPSTNLRLISDSVSHLEALLENFYEAMHRGSVAFDVIKLGEDDTERLFEHLTNRRSQRHSDAHAEIHYESGKREANLRCPFCGERETIAFYPHGVPSPAQMSRWHYDRCDGVIGCERINVDLVDVTGSQLVSTIEIDLRTPPRSTE